MDSYSKYLAEHVLTEDKVVTYRLLSRELQVHVNTAKQMLYDFHRTQNAKRPGAVHATYLVYGTKKPSMDTALESPNGDGDVEMTGSAPERYSVVESIPTSTLTLVPEDQLKDVLESYADVSSLHIYSIGPHPTKDMALLADVASQAQSLGSSEDQKSVVPIINPRAHRRERKGAGLKVAAATSAAAKQQAKPAANIAQATPFTKAKEEPATSQSKQESTEKAATSSGLSKKAAPAKRGVSSGIMQAFSKAATKPANSKKQETSQPATPSEEPNLPALSDDGEDDDDEMPQPKPRSVAGHKTRQQINQELREMMELEDEKEESKPETPEEEPIEEPMDEPAPEPEPAKEEENEVITSSSNGRRRGRRRVMRKKQIMDDQGYLVTIQEPAWESFSEDEAPPPTKPKSTAPSSASSQASKPGAKKGAPKGQGSIMNFFSKK